MRVELLATINCPHVQRTEDELSAALNAADGARPSFDLVYVSDLDNAAGLGFRGSPTVRIDGRDVVPLPSDVPINLSCRLYRQADGSLSGVVPAATIVAEIERRHEAEMHARAARIRVRDIPSRITRALFLWASHRRFMGRIATAIPLTRRMVRRFVPGDTLEDALTTLESLRDQGMRWTVDVLGESVESEEMATAAAGRYMETLEALAERGLEANVSLKLTQMGLEVDRDFCLRNVGRLVSRAREFGAFVRIDMEDHTKTEATLEMVRELHHEYAEVGAVIQSYLRRSAEDVQELNRRRIRVRLCKGAYDEPETVAYQSREEVDENFMQLAERLLADGRYPALATHDERMIEHALGYAAQRGIGADAYEFQMLYGVRRDLQERLVAAGQTVRVYVPYGTEWYPYYMRRLAERPQNVISILVSVLSEGRGDR